MPKKIVFCADGTWNQPHSPVTVEPDDTNVYKLFKCLAQSPTQFAAYDDGVGTSGLPVDRLVGAAFGAGLFQKIKDGYTAIAHLYEANDEVFIYGFSRGAYTARSLAGMIAVCGLPTKGFDQNLVDTAFNAYRNQSQRQALLASLAGYSLFDAKIKMLGVWDTVGSLGIPGALFGANNVGPYEFLDTNLHPDVLNAYQGLAIDERRGEFIPSLWTAAAPGNTLEQLWFAGCHSDVGGGNGRVALSNITLTWMLSRAVDNGIELAANPYQQYDPEGALGPIVDSWNVGWLIPKRRTIPDSSTICDSVADRLTSQMHYRPPNLTIDAQGAPSAGYSIDHILHPAAVAAVGP